MDQENNEQNLNNVLNQENTQIPQNEQPVTDASLNMPQENNKSSLSKIALSILVLIIVFAGGFFVYAQFVNPFVFMSPEKISFKAFQNTFLKISESDFSADVVYRLNGNMLDPMSDENVKIDANIKTKIIANDINTEKTKIHFIIEDATLKYQPENDFGFILEDMKFGAEAIVSTDKVFFRINNLPEMIMFFVGDAFVNKWIYIDQNSTEEMGISNISPDIRIQNKVLSDEEKQQVLEVVSKFFKENISKNVSTKRNSDGIFITYSIKGNDIFNLSNSILELTEPESVLDLQDFPPETKDLLNSMNISMTYFIDNKFVIRGAEFETFVIDTNQSMQFSAKMENLKFQDVPKIQLPENSIKIEEILGSMFGGMNFIDQDFEDGFVF
ncbi:MAG TPA: hypothetical protein PJ997_02105 [Candidatus Paceibacterota bacterium]|nr:hypothetical protein [Candidatus Paceibacterota bacterium]HMP19109.1 hypothetical protein [Candidatus Paceibacterota bacterium]HMP85113.1 hypothetical protein [Candidatus Paceibacterota bacterium]